MISHDMRAVYRYCTHVLELEDGKVVQYGPIDRSEAAQKQSRIIRKPRKSNGSVSATHVLLNVTKHEEGRHCWTPICMYRATAGCIAPTPV